MHKLLKTNKLKKTLLLLLLLTTTICGHSQVVDAFKGVWPVTDPAAMKSLNGEWQLRVVNRIDDHGATVPVADETWGRIPVPGCWERLQVGELGSGMTHGFSKPKYNYPDSLTAGHMVSTGGSIENPKLWTAETPYLYTLRVYVKEKGKTLQTFTQKIGIREVSIDGNILKVNGQPVKLRGVNAHSTAIPDAVRHLPLEIRNHQTITPKL